MKTQRSAAASRASTLAWLAATSWACGNLLGADELRFDRALPPGGSSGGFATPSPGGASDLPTADDQSGRSGASGAFGGTQNPDDTREPDPNAGTNFDIRGRGGSGRGVGGEGIETWGDGGAGGMPSVPGDGGTSGTPTVRDDGPAGGAAGFAGAPPDSLVATGGSSVVLQSIPLISVPSTYEYYCSVRVGKGWALAWNPDPCAYLLTRYALGADAIQRAGVFDRNGRNNVVIRCAKESPATYTGIGHTPLSKAFEWATMPESRENCVFTVAPTRLPIFGAPFSLNRLPAGFQITHRGYDFASAPGASGFTGPPEATLDVRAYSQTALEPSRCATPILGCATVVSYRGEDRSGFPEQNDSQGFEWHMAAGMPILALADGEVVARRTQRAEDCNGEQETDLYIKHVVATRATSPYAETFVIHYSHLTLGPGIDVGRLVHAGQIVGHVSDMACAGGTNRLHLSVIRLSNTAAEYRPMLDTTPGVYGLDGRAPDNSVARIDPYGWMASQVKPNVDPGGHRWLDWEIPFMGPAGTTRIGGGALSIDLWREGEAPPRACDRNDTDWPGATGPLKNSHAHCER